MVALCYLSMQNINTYIQIPNNFIFTNIHCFHIWIRGCKSFYTAADTDTYE
jgi:hypothetical protein